jgi:hypothetical protein
MNNVDPTGECSKERKDSETLCDIEDKVKEVLEPVLESIMKFVGIKVIPKEKRDPEGEYKHEAQDNTTQEEVVAIAENLVDESIVTEVIDTAKEGGAIVITALGISNSGGRKGGADTNGNPHDKKTQSTGKLTGKKKKSHEKLRPGSGTKQRKKKSWYQR